MALDKVKNVLFPEPNHRLRSSVILSRTLPAHAGELPTLGHLVDKGQAACKKPLDGFCVKKRLKVMLRQIV